MIDTACCFSHHGFDFWTAISVASVLTFSTGIAFIQYPPKSAMFAGGEIVSKPNTFPAPCSRGLVLKTFSSLTSPGSWTSKPVSTPIVRPSLPGLFLNRASQSKTCSFYLVVTATDTVGNGAVSQFFNIASGPDSTCFGVETLPPGSPALSTVYPGGATTSGSASGPTGGNR